MHCARARYWYKSGRWHWEAGTRPGEVLHFDLLYVGDSGHLGEDGLREGDGFKFILVIMDNLSNFMLLEPIESCTGALPILCD